MANAKSASPPYLCQARYKPQMYYGKACAQKRSFNVHLVCSSVLFRGSDSAENWAISLVSLAKHGANIWKYFQYSKEKGQKVTLLWFSGLQQYAFDDYSTWKKGERYGQTGSEAAYNRERDGVSLNSNARTHELRRAPLYLGAPALICWSGRSKPSFIP